MQAKAIALGLIALLFAGCSGGNRAISPAAPEGQLQAIISPENHALTAAQKRAIRFTFSPHSLPSSVHMISTFPSGTRIYSVDVVLLQQGKNFTIIPLEDTVTRQPNGEIVWLDSAGKLINTFPSSAQIQIQKSAGVKAVFPGSALPKKFENASPIEVIK